MIKYLFLALLVISPTLLFSQNTSLLEKAIDLEKKDSIDSAIVLLDSCIKSDPYGFDCKYEKAVAFFQKKNYEKVVAILSDLIKDEKSTDRAYEVLGSSYLKLNNFDKADSAFSAAMIRFPASGRIHLNYGNLKVINDSLKAAMIIWDEGAQLDRYYDPLYYSLCIGSISMKKITYATLFGEIYLNLSHNLKKFQEISKEVYSSYAKVLPFDNDTNPKLKFSRLNNYYPPDLKGLNTDYLVQIISDSTLTKIDLKKYKMPIAKLEVYLQAFTETWKNNNLSKEYPNAVMDWRIKLLDNNYFDCYVYWLFQYVSPKEYGVWLNKGKNKDRLKAFGEWLEKNTIEINMYNVISQFK